MAEYTKIAIGDIGTQVFWFNKATGHIKFEYALPVTAGAEFGGDTESFDASETDLDYIPKIGGRTSINDIAYVVNYTSEKYQRILEISDNTDVNTYMEVLSDGSAAIFRGTSGMPTITSGDVRQINWNVAPSYLKVITNIADLSESDVEHLDALALDLGYTAGSTGGAGLDHLYELVPESTTKYQLRIDLDTIPKARQDYFATKNIVVDED